MRAPLFLMFGGMVAIDEREQQVPQTAGGEADVSEILQGPADRTNGRIQMRRKDPQPERFARNRTSLRSEASSITVSVGQR